MSHGSGRRRAAVAVAIAALGVPSWLGAAVGDQGALDDAPATPIAESAMFAAARQSLDRTLFLPFVRGAPAASDLPRAVAPLGHAFRDLEWIDGVLYGAVGPVVQALATSGAQFRVAATSAPLPGVVLDIVVGHGVIYAAHIDPWDASSAAGGLTTLAATTPLSLREVGRLPMGAGTGYESLALNGTTLAARRCTVVTGGRVSCAALDFVDVTDVRQPVLLSSLAVADQRAIALPGVAALSGSRFTDGRFVIDASEPARPEVVASLEAPGHPAAQDEVLATIEDVRVHLYADRRGEEPVLLGARRLAEVGIESAATAWDVTARGVMLAGTESSTLGGPGRWAVVPVTDSEIGFPATFRSDLITTGLASSRDYVWHARSWGDPRLDLGDATMLPYTPSIGQILLGPDGVPVGAIEQAWRGWNWRTADVEVTGAVAYALSDDDGDEWDPDPLALSVYDIFDPISPRFVKEIPDVCLDSGDGWGQYRELESCSLVAATPGLLLVSGREGAATLDVTVPTLPVVALTGPSLGTQLTATPAGVVGLLGTTVQHPTTPEMVLFDVAQPGWPRETWSTALMDDAYKLVASQHGERTAVALTSAGESGPVSIWAGWLDGDAPPVWQRIEDPHWTDLPWAPRTLELQGDWLYITRHSGESAADGAPVVERYRLTDEGLDLETTIPVPGLELPIGATVIADVLVVQDPYRLHFVSVSPDSDPTVLGSALYADGAISDPNWRDWNLVPRLTAIGERHFYVTAHPNAQVWTMP